MASTDEPGRIARLPKNKAGYPVPWFVAWIDGEPDFRVANADKLRSAIRRRLCWTCGGPLGGIGAFTIGPMCAVNRVSTEPPSHRECAEFSATFCPFLNTPQMTRRDRGKPADAVNPAGIMITRNPGVALVWVTGYRSWHLFSDHEGGTLFDIGDPKETLWFARGRAATRGEVLASIDSGLPILAEMAEKDGPEAWSGLYEKLGRPKDEAGYKIDVPEELKPYFPEANLAAGRKAAFAGGLNQKQVDAISSAHSEVAQGIFHFHYQQIAHAAHIIIGILAREQLNVTRKV